MYPSQLASAAPHQRKEIDYAIDAIVAQIQARSCHERPFQVRYMAFPLFLVGVMSPSPDNKKLALEFLTDLEKECLGHNIRATREILYAIYQEQHGREEMDVGYTNVDWKEFMMRGGHKVVNFAF